MNIIAKAAAIVGSQATLARLLHVSPPFITQLMRGERPIPTHHAIAIERETGGAVTVEELRPDIEWSVIRGKPAKEKAA